jgi:DNA primase
MISQDEIEAIKHGVELVSFMKARGIELHQVGENYRGFCPFHEDTTPSLTVNPKENLWNCFGCGTGGDVIRFVELIDQVDFKEAVRAAERPPSKLVRGQKTEVRSQKSEDRGQKREKQQLKKKRKGSAWPTRSCWLGGTEFRRQRTEVRKDRVRKC